MITNYNQYILWQPIQRENKIDKIPIDYRTFEIADAHNSNIWLDYQTAKSMVDMLGGTYGIGFVFTENDPFFFIDIDHCLIGNQWSVIAMDLMQRLSGAYIEVSQSCEGLHIIGTAVNPPSHGCKNTQLGIELYTQGRFVALTGINAIGSPGTQLLTELTNIITLYFPSKTHIASHEWTDKPCPEWNGPKDDDVLIDRALKSTSAASAFGGRASFKDLWIANKEVLNDCYPHETNSYDESAADAALAQHLAFWTGKDCERVKRIMFRSSLVRDKWRRDDYMQRTILNAVSMQRDVLGKSTDIKPILPDKIEPLLVEGFQYLAAPQQLELFKNCVYITELHRIFIPNGMLLKSDQFNALYGGYIFQLDSDAVKTTRKAWEVFTESQAVRFPKVSGTCFKPNDTPGAIISENGRSLLNVYLPLDVPSKQGNVQPFLDHLSKLLPNQYDQQILLAYMAAIVQYKGIKFQWAPLIQGVEGNGKTLLTRCVAAAIGRRYVHFPKAMDIDNKFNGWLLNKIFIGVEDIYVPDHRREVLETLKPMITGGDGLEIQLKGIDQVTADICANFMLNSNHKDAIRKTRNDRRFCVFYTAQQTVDDIIRDGMAGDYFPRLYHWLNTEGYAAITHYLQSYRIPDELNPAILCHRAPKTTSTDEALNASLGSIEQEIIEAIEEGRPGFAGGWISSKAFDRMLLELRRNLPLNKRRELLQSLGYDWHPNLKGGRVNSYIHLDDGKPRLFIKEGHISRNLTQVSEITKAYIEAQTVTTISRRFGMV